ncbi:MAG: hypothetical protein V7L29_21080 [Nostoc sp.]|uniref:hypothetical protein n=1 Tax=Nostoc sp. TaxID=1180 RepID=UPI002FF9C49B
MAFESRKRPEGGFPEGNPTPKTLFLLSNTNVQPNLQLFLFDQSNTRAIVAIAKNVAIKSKLRVAPG